MNKTRRLIAATAARIMVEEYVHDYISAKRKAIERLGMENTGHLPRNEEVEKHVIEYQRLFRTDSQPLRLRELRETAIAVMKMMTRFRPRLVGTVLHGTADQHSEIQLHVFADTPEKLLIFFLDNNISYDTGERLLRFASSGRLVCYPKYRLFSGHTPIEITAFPEYGLRQAPLSPVDGKPMLRAPLDKVVQLARGSGLDHE